MFEIIEEGVFLGKGAKIGKNTIIGDYDVLIKRNKISKKKIKSLRVKFEKQRSDRLSYY